MTRFRFLVPLGLAIAITALIPARGEAATAQDPRLSEVLRTFLVDEGVRTRGLPWTTGDALPVNWESAAPIANPDAFALRQGLTKVRAGTFRGVISDSVTLDMRLELSGNDAGLQRVLVHIPSLLVSRPDGSGFFLLKETVMSALTDNGLVLSPLKCSRETEGASYGNLVDAVRAPGKTASGLWWLWQSPQQEPTLTMTILYRRADMDAVECAGGPVAGPSHPST